jgi:hypothetical protein
LAGRLGDAMPCRRHHGKFRRRWTAFLAGGDDETKPTLDFHAGVITTSLEHIHRNRRKGHTMRILLFALPLAAFATPALAQTDTNAQAWATVSASTDLADGVGLTLEGVARFGDDADGIYEAEFGGWLDFDAGDGVTVSTGYVRVPGYSNGDLTKMEDRPRQQISFPLASFGGGKLSARVRIEERLRRGGDDVGLRLRPQIKYSLPFHAGGKTALVLSHESFVEINDTDWGQVSGYARMRNAIGVKTPLNDTISVEAGYLNQYDLGRNGAHDKMAHVATLALSLGF